MSVIATAVRHLMAAGVTGEALLEAIGEMEAQVRAEPKPRSAGAIRQARYRHNKASQVTESDACDAAPSLSRPPLSSPQSPQQTPPTHTHPETSPRVRARGTRLSPFWEPEPFTGDLAEAVALWPPGALERELAQFRDWAAAATGQNAVKADWQAAWRNWCRRAETEGRHPNERPQPRPFAGQPGVVDIAQQVLANKRAARAAGGSR